MSESEPRLADYLGHIVEATGRIAGYIGGMTDADFLCNTLVQDAVIRNIEIIGEAARNVQRRYPEFAAGHDDVPWEDAYWMRNRLSHGYFSVDMEIVWKAVERDIPELERQVRRLLKGQEGHSTR